MTSRIEQNGYNRELSGSHSVLQRLLPRHLKIMDLHLEGLSYQDIATRVSLKKRQVANIVNSPVFQQALAIRRSKIEDNVDEHLIKTQESVLDIIKENTFAAVDKLVDLMSSDNDSVARQSANDILDRGGFPKVQRQEQDTTTTLILEDDQAKILAQTLKEISESE